MEEKIMRTIKQYIKLAVVILIAFACLACSTTSKIVSYPSGAKVYVNGEHIGDTPVDFNSKTGMPERYHLELHKEGFQPLSLYIDAEMSIAWAFTVVPISMGAGLLWAWGLDDMYKIKLVPVED